MDGKYLSESEIIENKASIAFEELLLERKLSEETLVKLMGYINLYQVLITQDLSLDFICRYILNDSLYRNDNETTITIELVITHQPYSFEEINEYIKIY